MERRRVGCVPETSVKGDRKAGMMGDDGLARVRMGPPWSLVGSVHIRSE